MIQSSGFPTQYLPLVESAAGLIFDCDGTLVDSMPLHFLAWHQTMLRYGLNCLKIGFMRSVACPAIVLSKCLRPSNRSLSMLSMLPSKRNKRFWSVSICSNQSIRLWRLLGCIEVLSPFRSPAVAFGKSSIGSLKSSNASIGSMRL